MSAPAVSALLRSIRPTFRSADDRIAYAVHAWMLARGYKLVAIGDATAQDAASKPEIDLKLEGSDHTLLYADAESSGKKAPVTLRLVPLGSDKLLLNLLPHGDAATAPMVLDVDISAFTTAQEGTMEGYKDLPKLIQLFDTRLAGSSSGAEPANKAQSSSAGAEKQNTGSSLLEEHQPRGAGGLRAPLPGTGDVGRSDLYPPGMGGPLIDPMRGPMLPGGGGMHVGPRDPIFMGGARGPLRGPHPGTLPPGGRWDPISPEGLPGFNPDDFQRGGPRPHPDVQPPGPGRGTDWDSMFG